MLLLAAFAAGCVFETDVPSGARITCVTGADCPAGSRCAESLGTCVDAREQDDSAPSAESVDVAPSFARDDSVVVVELTVSQQLGRAPSVVAAGPSSLGFELDADGESTTSFRFVHTVAPTDPEGVYAVTADLVDALGNSAAGLVLGSFTIDRTPPSLVTDSLRESLTAPFAAVSEVTALGPLGLLEIEGLTTEPLAETPTASSDPAGLGAAVELNGQLVRAAFRLESAPDGDVTTTLTMHDRAGNEGTVELATVAVDSATPARPPVDVPDCVRLIRYPWGADDSGGVPSVSVVFDAENPACLLPDERGTAVVHEVLSSGETITLATARITDHRVGDIDLGVADATRVALGIVDEAGNASELGALRDIEWVATLGGKIAGTQFPNPHRVEVRAIHTPSLEQSGGLELDGDAVASTDGLLLTSTGAPHWLQLERGGPVESSMFGTYDQGRGRVVAFGESTVWEWTGARWRSLIVDDPEGDGGPVDLGFSGVGYDARRDRVVIVVGQGLFQTDSWEWDGRSFKRLEQDPTCTPVGAQFAAAVEWHPALQRVAMVGGSSAVAPLRALVLDDLGCWVPMPGDPARLPPERAAAGLAADDVNQRLVMFSGIAETSLQDTWVHDGVDWTQVGGPQPPPTTAAAMAQDGAGTILAIAGTVPDVQLWALDNEGWSQVPQDTTQQAAIQRSLPALVFDEARRRIVLFGGGDTQEWVTDRFEPRTLAPLAPALTIARVDASSCETVFGPAVVGGSDTAQTSSTSLSLWSGAQWIDAGAGPASPLTGAHIIDDGAALLVFGGDQGLTTSDQTWLYRGPDQWEAVGPSPSARAFAAIGYDEERGVVVLFGGFGPQGGPERALLSETWEWHGEALGWQQPALVDDEGDGNPAARAYGSLGWDPERRELLLVGGLVGFTALDDTWSFNGTRWRNVTPVDDDARARRPMARLALDEERGRLALFGDEDYGAPLGSALEWVGGQWVARAPIDVEGNGVPLRRQRPIVGHDPMDRRVVLSGGQQPSLFFMTSVSDGTWAWDSGAHSHPSVLFGFDLQAALIPDAADVTRIAVSALVTGNAPDGGVDTSGARLSWWRAGRFEALASSTDSALTPLGYATTDAGAIESLRSHRSGKVFISMEAPADNGTEEATVSVDVAELRVRYRLP